MGGKKWPGLDNAFLRYIRVRPEVQKENQRIYLSFFDGCRKVADLGCGDGDFTELLAERGIDAIGVDADPVSCEAARDRGIPVECSDVFAYLERQPAADLDGVFASHLVEHLHYEEVLRLFELSHQVLRPGGVVVVTTPNVRALVSHLELFWLHFGHISFYHPRLLSFFLEQVGFAEVTSGENELPGWPLMPELRASLAQGGQEPAGSPMASCQARALEGTRRRLARLVRRLRIRFGRLLIGPCVDQLTRRMDILSSALQRLDRPFECYVAARKPGASQRAPLESASAGNGK